MSEPDLEKQREALDGSGLLLHAAVARRLENSGWKVGTNVPSSIAPFLAGSVEPGNLNVLNDVAGSQNEHLRKEAPVDVVAVRPSHTTGVLCVGIEKMDPKRANWVFADPRPNSERFFAVCKTVSEQEPDDLVHVEKAGDRVTGLSVRMQGYELRLDDKIYGQGVSFNRHAEGDYYADDSLAGASQRIIEGTCGLAVESFIRHVSLGAGEHTERFIPVIVTTAGILSCEYSQDGTGASGASNAKLVPKNYAVYDCPVPMRARFPRQMMDVSKPASRDAKWPILIANPKGLEEFLGNI